MNNNITFNQKYPHLFNYKGCLVAQMIGVIEVFESILNELNFSHIIEIGTLNGGFTSILSDIIEKNNLQSHIITFDIEDKISSDILDKKNVTFIHSDIFNNIQFVENIIKTTKKTV